MVLQNQQRIEGDKETEPCEYFPFVVFLSLQHRKPSNQEVQLQKGVEGIEVGEPHEVSIGRPAGPAPVSSDGVLADSNGLGDLDPGHS